MGPRIAQRIVNELAGKTGEILALSLNEGMHSTDDSSADGAETSDVAPSGTARPSSNARAEALSALVNLGYGQGEAMKFVAETLAEYPNAETETVIREALRRMVPSG